MRFEGQDTGYPEGGDWEQIAATFKLTPEQAIRVEAAAEAVGGRGMHLARVIHHESRFRTTAQFGRTAGQPYAPGRATGLIQFTPTIAEMLGVTTAEIFEMPFEDQMDLVEEYLQHVADGGAGGGSGPLDTQEKMALAVFYPNWRNKPLDTPLPKDVADRNKVATIGEYVAKVLEGSPGGAASGGLSVRGAGERRSVSRAPVIVGGALTASLAFLVLSGCPCFRKRVGF